MAVYFVRHGHREDWENPAWKATALRPQDPKLSMTGLTQASEVAAFFGAQNGHPPAAHTHRPHNVRHIFASPFVRVLQTATAIADVLDLPINVENGVIEWLIEGHDVDPLPVEELAELFPRVNRGYRSHVDLPRGEDRGKLQLRADVIMKHLTERYVKEGEDVLIVSHAAPIIMLTRALVGDPKATVNVATCSVSCYQRLTADAAWTPLLNGHTQHLSDGELANWQFPEDLRYR
eukprot:TRINITY_DN32658_c0_g1_i1.p1 TRINITY_DN32658_c0_g1~~TRINITY_DN32658_c0_g1_i1.p1  ORF type:complete len:234 (+),score=43.54 TRINITY_DN32658_c0_g1_i1:165-866(+)